MLWLSILLLMYLCITSILGPVRFEKIREQREKAVIQRLMEIRKAEIEYKEQNGKYTASFDSLFQFIKTAKKKRVILAHFRRDTVETSLLKELFPNYTAENIEKMSIIPYSKNDKFELKVNNNYTNASGIRIPLFEAAAPYESYLYDLDKQELFNLIDKAENENKFPGLKVGSIIEPNNNAGNWE